VLQRAAQGGEGLTRRFALISLARAGVRDGRGAHGTENLLATRRFLLGELQAAATPVRPWAALALGVGEALRVQAGNMPSGRCRPRSARGSRITGTARGRRVVAGHVPGAASEGARDAARGSARRARLGGRGRTPAMALGLLGWDGAVISLRKVVQDSRFRPLVLRDASIALGMLGSSEAVTGLVGMLGDAQSIAVQSAIASALGYVGDERSLDALLELMKKSARPDRVRAFAAAALGGVCDTSSTPWNAPIASSVNYWLTRPRSTSRARARASSTCSERPSRPSENRSTVPEQEYGARLDHELLAPSAGPGRGREEFVIEPGTVLLFSAKARGVRDRAWLRTPEKNSSGGGVDLVQAQALEAAEAVELRAQVEHRLGGRPVVQHARHGDQHLAVELAPQALGIDATLGAALQVAVDEAQDAITHLGGRLQGASDQG
jgi:hypothetical protein